MTGIYKITCLVNNRVYVGQSYNIDKRWKNHKLMLNTCSHHNYKLQEDWIKYGESAFAFDVVENHVNTNFLHQRERAVTKSIDKSLCYNTKTFNSLPQKRQIYNITKALVDDHFRNVYWPETV